MVVAVEEEEVPTPTGKAGSLDKFWHLGNAKKNASRIEASSRLLKLAANNPTEAEYTMKRLIRGLASPVESSRQGFFICLVEFLRQHPVEYKTVQQEVKEILKVCGSRGEESLYLLGQILADIALLRSGAVKTKPDRVKVLENLIENGSKRSYLHLITINTIIEYFLCDGSEISPEDLVTSLEESFKLKLAEAGLDSLLFILSFFALKGKDSSPEFLTDNFGFKDISKKKNLQRISKILLETTLPLRNITTHPALPVLVQQVCEKKAAGKLFQYFLPEMTTVYKGQIGIAILSECLKTDPSTLVELLSPECLGVLRNLAAKGAVEPVMKVMDQVEAQAKEGTIDNWTIISRFLEASVSWDKHVPGNTVSFLFSVSDQDTVVKIGELLRTKLISEGSVSDRVYAAGLLAKLVAHPQVINNIDWRVSILSTLLELTVITVPDSKVPALSKEAKLQLKDVFYRGLDSNCKTLMDTVNLVSRLMKHAQNLLEKQAGVPVKPISDESKEAWSKVVATVAKLASSWKESGRKETGVFLMLFCHIGLQIFSQPEMAVDVLSELHPVYANWSKAKTSKGDPAGIEVVVEIMLTLLAQNKHILRNVVNCIFRVISDQLTEPALQSILAVLEGGEGEEEAGSEDEDEEEDEEDDGDDEENKDGNDENEDDSEEEDSDEEEEEDEAVNSGLVEKVKSALGDHADAEDEDVDMDDIPEEDMAKLDEKLVEAFRALGGRKSGLEKKKEKLDHLAKQHFKLRVLDLLDIYISHKPSVPLVFAIISSLIERFKELFKVPKEAALCNRIKTILGKCHGLKLDPCPGFGGSAVLEYLLQLGTTSSSAVVSLGNIHARLCLKALRISLPEHAERAEKLYLDALNQFFVNNQCMLSHDVFEAAVGIPWNGASAIAKEVSVQAFNPKVRHFRRSQGLGILTAFLHNQQLADEFKEEKKNIFSATREQIMELMGSGLQKAKPKLLLEIFSILRGMKQQGLMTEEQVGQVKQSLTELGKSFMNSTLPANVKKNFKKVLSYYHVKVEFGKMKKPARVEKNGVENGVEESTKEEDEEKEEGEKPEEAETKKKKKKKKNKDAEKRKKERKLESAGAEDEASIPSFSEFLVDTTQVYADPNKKKKMKRKNAENTTPQQKKKKKSES